MTEVMDGFPQGKRPQEHVLKEIDGICARDHRYERGRIFNSICSQPHPVAIKAYLGMIESNLGDNRVCPGAVQLEQMTVSLLGHLFHHPQACGNIVSGGTEANLLALFVAKELGRRRGITQPEVVVPFSAHFSLDKIAKILGLQLRYTPLDARFKADVQEMERNISENTVAIVGTAGTSELGAIDPIEDMAALAKAHGIYFHVDAATGGFIIPFAMRLGYAVAPFDFALDGVCSLTVDPHKYGLSVIPSGCVLFRSQAFQDMIDFQSHYVGTQPHTTFLGTRTGASAASTYAVIQHLGEEGYCQIVKENFEKRDFLVNAVRARGWSLLVQPELTIVAIQCPHGQQVLERLERRGWIVSLSKRNNAVRIVVHHHHTHRHVAALVDELSCVL